jgi:phosphoglycerate kinase
VVLASHFARPEAGKFEEKYSLFPVYKRLDTLLKIKRNLYFDDSKSGAVITPRAKELFDQMEAGDVLLLENLRFDARETKDDPEFARELSQFGEFYVNDAFGACHRKHASIHAITQFYDADHKAAGFLLAKEINFFDRVLQNPSRPFVAVVGGSKVSGKLEALNRLLSKVDRSSSVGEWPSPSSRPRATRSGTPWWRRTSSTRPGPSCTRQGRTK